jgi:hypothetical protein
VSNGRAGSGSPCLLPVGLKYAARLAVPDQRPMKIQFQGTVDADEAADAFILAFLARHKGNPVTAGRIWESLKGRGFVPTDGRPTSPDAPDEGAATAEISRRLQHWLDEGLIGGDAVPESITGNRHFWALGKGPGEG